MARPTRHATRTEAHGCPIRPSQATAVPEVALKLGVRRRPIVQAGSPLGGRSAHLSIRPGSREAAAGLGSSVPQYWARSGGDAVDLLIDPAAVE
jgi:hypothetical protein